MLRIETLSIIANPDFDLVLIDTKSDTRVASPGMACNVVQSLLCNAVNAGLQILPEIAGNLFGLNLYLHVASPRDLAGLPFDRGYETQIVQHGRAE